MCNTFLNTLCMSKLPSGQLQRDACVYRRNDDSVKKSSKPWRNVELTTQNILYRTS